MWASMCKKHNCFRLLQRQIHGKQYSPVSCRKPNWHYYTLHLAFVRLIQNIPNKTISVWMVCMLNVLHGFSPSLSVLCFAGIYVHYSMYLWLCCYIQTCVVFFSIILYDIIFKCNVGVFVQFLFEIIFSMYKDTQERNFTSIWMYIWFFPYHNPCVFNTLKFDPYMTFPMHNGKKH